MSDCEKEEAVNLQREFEWVLNQEVHVALDQIHGILVECARRFPVQLYGHDGSGKQEKLVVAVAPAGGWSSPEQLRCAVTLTGDSITHADISFRVQRGGSGATGTSGSGGTTLVRTAIHSDCPWKLQQVQDAANHLQQAIYHIDDVGKEYRFRSSDEVLHILGEILGSLQRGRTSLVVPRKRAIDDLIKSRNMKALAPNLAEDLAISFYIQSHKLVFAVYQLSNSHGTMKYDCAQSECSVPWLNEVLVLLTVGLQLCQQIKDKICVFSQYKDFTVGVGTVGSTNDPLSI